MTETHGPSVILVTGISASGKSTVARLLAERLPRAAHVRGDLFRRMVVTGRAEPTPGATDSEAARQLALRYRLAATVADGYAEAGFTAVLQDVVLGSDLAELVAMIRGRPLLVVVLAPRPDVVAARDAARGKSGYHTWSIAELDAALRAETPRIGLWIDNSEQTPEETVERILAGMAGDTLIRA